MVKRSKPVRRARDVLSPQIVERMARDLAPAELTPADREALHERIMQRIAEIPPQDFRIA